MSHLILSRFEGQSIVIGSGDSEVRVTVERIKCGEVKLGIVAPRDLPVLRKEVYDAIARGGSPR